MQLSDSCPEKRRSPKQKKVIVTDSSLTSGSSESKDDMRSKVAPIEKKVVAVKRPSTLTDKATHDEGYETLSSTIHKMRAATKSRKRKPAIKKKTVATTNRMKAVALAQTPDPAPVHGDRDIKPEKSPSNNIPIERKSRPIPITQRLDDPEPSLEDAFDAIYFVEDMANTVREIVNRVDQKYRRHARAFFDKRFGKQTWKN